MKRPKLDHGKSGKAEVVKTKIPMAEIQRPGFEGTKSEAKQKPKQC